MSASRRSGQKVECGEAQSAVGVLRLKALVRRTEVYQGNDENVIVEKRSPKGDVSR